MKIELFYVPGCHKCAASKQALQAAAAATVEGVEWREVNVLESIDYAVELGVLTLPAIAIDDALVFTCLPTPAQLRQELLRRAGHA